MSEDKHKPPTEYELAEFMDLLDTHAQTYVDEMNNQDAKNVAEHLVNAYRDCEDDGLKKEYAKGLRMLYVLYGEGMR
tara:strand:- start:270 stop:500 length:231 start_codon:yes stop_codon:yes gene_type:complete